MGVFALTFAGSVAQISDAEFPVQPAMTWVDVSSLSPQPQVGWSYAEGAFAPPAAPPALTLAEQAIAAIGAGLTITSPTLGVTAVPFDVGPDAQAHVNAEITSILLNNVFADGGSSVAWPDLIVPYPAQHSWTVDQFKLFATAHAAYVASLYKVINGTSTTLPPASVTLA